MQLISRHRLHVSRRYREFFALDKSLDSTLPESVQLPEFPSKSTFGRMSPSLVRSRRMELERYLRALLADADICALEQVRLFCKMPEGCHEPQVVVESCLDAIPEKCTSSMAACTYCVCMCVHPCMCVCMYACMHACMHVFMCVCIISVYMDMYMHLSINPGGNPVDKMEPRPRRAGIDV